MKRILLTTTSLVLAAGVAQAEVTFSGKAEVGVSRTEEVKGSAPTAGKYAWVKVGTVNTLTLDKTVTISTTVTAAAEALTLQNAKAAATKGDAIVAAEAAAALSAANRAYNTGTEAKKVGDMVAYSGYDMDVSVSSTLDNGMELSAAFDMGAGSIADRDDDRILDAQVGAIALSAVTIKNGGVTYVIGNDEIDDLYDDTQNGDVSVSGAMGGISYTLVADLDKDTAAVAASTLWTEATGSTADDTLVVTAAKDPVYESTSLKLSGAAAGVDWTFTTTNKNDRGNAASKVSLGYAAGDALSFTLTHDTQGKREAINTLKASYTMDAITLTASMADDKNHAGNTNTGGKASQNLTIAYANGPLTASFNNDESSAWWATTSYDLGIGADIFATVDHTEFAVVGLSFNF